MNRILAAYPVTAAVTWALANGVSALPASRPQADASNPVRLQWESSNSYLLSLRFAVASGGATGALTATLPSGTSTAALLAFGSDMAGANAAMYADRNVRLRIAGCPASLSSPAATYYTANSGVACSCDMASASGANTVFAGPSFVLALVRIGYPAAPDVPDADVYGRHWADAGSPVELYQIGSGRYLLSLYFDWTSGDYPTVTATLPSGVNRLTTVAWDSGNEYAALDPYGLAAGDVFYLDYPGLSAGNVTFTLADNGSSPLPWGGTGGVNVMTYLDYV